MHIILGILGSVITILVLVKQLSCAGIDLGRFNPFTWFRLNKWQKAYNADPAFSLDRPMEAVAGLLYVMAKCSGHPRPAPESRRLRRQTHLQTGRISE